ncbi:alpha/beta-hydrolase [Fomitiporia mediterranea MF3/22]|uniref:alpha/beta-hydrolase n=1 Tax=Fomitiporia mediterranea (strain MF3/22) TaxID=694068 RepID=UPI0004408026|nr:alpha/beta-hydrolase [Fomitiporia mediterranea MF3/22]EJD03372.1 alpha/beta-hydrolase [Fomitiporia mediterranea MF3/22]
MHNKILRKFVHSADGTKIYADAVGDSAHPALVFVHGFSSSAAVFDDIFSNPDNSKEFYLASTNEDLIELNSVRYDVRGFGRSGKSSEPEGHASQRYAEEVKAILQAFNVKKPIFVAWSMGGRIMADIASYLPPNTFLGVVCLAGSPYSNEQMRDTSTAAMKSLVQGLLTNTDVLAEQQAVVAANRLLFLRDPNPSSDFLRKTAEAIANGADFHEENPDVSYATRCALVGMAMYMSPKDRFLAVSRQQDNTKIIELGRSGFPLLVIYGTHDAYISGEKMVDIVRPVFVNMKVKVIEGASHAPFLEKPNEVMKDILDFARDLTK